MRRMTPALLLVGLLIGCSSTRGGHPPPGGSSAGVIIVKDGRDQAETPEKVQKRKGRPQLDRSQKRAPGAKVERTEKAAKIGSAAKGEKRAPVGKVEKSAEAEEAERNDRAEKSEKSAEGAANGQSARRIEVPKGHHPPPGQCRLWHPGRPPGQQPSPARCERLAGRIPSGALILYNGREWDTRYDWREHERRNRGSVPGVILSLTRSLNR